MAPAMPLELALALTRPALPPLRARHDLCRVELERHLRGCLGVGLVGQPRGLLLLSQLTPGPAEELASALGRAQLLGQLIAAARISLAIRSNSWLTSGLALPAIRVPSIDTTPGFTSPARSHSLNTSPNRSASARSCRPMKRAIVA